MKITFTLKQFEEFLEEYCGIDHYDEKRESELIEVIAELEQEEKAEVTEWET